MLLAAGALPLVAGSPSAASQAPGAAGAAARVGERILAILPGGEIRRLCIHAAALGLAGPSDGARHRVPEKAGLDLSRLVAEDHRAGRVVKVAGVSLSLTEAAWCLAAADSPAAATEKAGLA